MGRKSRQKGKRGEREACEVLRDLFPDVKRTAMQSRGGGEQPDLANTGVWWVEVGVGNVNPASKWAQARGDMDSNVWVGHPPPSPIALTKRDRSEWLVTLHVEDFKALLKDANEIRAARFVNDAVMWQVEADAPELAQKIADAMNKAASKEP